MNAAKRQKFSERDIKRLHNACIKGKLKDVKAMLAEGIDPNVHDRTIGTRPLHYAAYNNRISIVRVLLEAGADINAREGYDGIDRPLETAAKAGLLKMVKFLTASHAKINVDGVCPALTEAAVNNHPSVVEFLINIGAKPESNLVSRAMWSCNVALIERLIKSGFKIVGNAKKEDKAIVSGAVRQAAGSDMVHLIAKHGADLHSPLNDDGATPLHSATHEDTALFLIKAGTNIRAINRFGEMPLHTCAKRGFTQACKIMLELGADPRIKTRRGYTPRMVAKLCGRKEPFDLFTKALKAPTPAGRQYKD